MAISLCTAHPVVVRRRAYDRSLAEGAGQHRHHTAAAASSSYQAGYWAYETRRRPGATHAWQRQGPTNAGHRHPGYPPPPGGRSRSSPYTHPQAGPEHHRDPFSSPNVQRATGYSRHNQPTPSDHIHSVSTFWRTMQVIGVVMVIATVGGGFSANA
jgi:hypothetical protein